MREHFLPLAPPSIGHEEVQAVTEVLQSGWISTGPKTKEFEKVFGEYVQAESALAVNSCTAALHLSLMAHGIGPGDEVITSAMTFSATTNVIEHVGATVVLADIHPGTLLIDPRHVAQKITPKTKAIIPVHYAGHPADMDTLNKLASDNGLHIIEDAAHCPPSKIHGRMVGSSQNLTAFSFYASKNVTTGEGGMLTGPTALIDRVRNMSLHGMSRDAWKRFQKGGSWQYDVAAPGFKYNMSDIQAALGLVQLRKLDAMYKRRCEIVAQYNESFGSLKYLMPLQTVPDYQSSHHLYVIQLNLELLKIDRNEFMSELTSRNIGTSVHYTPIHLLSFYRDKYGWRPEDFPVATQCFKQMITLPLSPLMVDQDVVDVVEAVTEIATKNLK